MTFAVGDMVRVTFNPSGFFGKIGTIIAADRMKILPYQVALPGGYNVFFDEKEIGLVMPEIPEVGDMVRVCVDGTVERYEDRDGGVVLVVGAGGEYFWAKAKNTEVTSKAAKVPAVLRVGDTVVAGVPTPVGSVARKNKSDMRALFNGLEWVYITESFSPVASHKLKEFVVYYVPPVVES